jgi:outer membrane protein assembly factor BamB
MTGNRDKTRREKPMTARKFLVTGITLGLLTLGLGACTREIPLQGERFPVRTDLDASVPVEGQPLPVAQALDENRSVPIRLPGMVANAEWPQRGGNARHDAIHGKLSANPVLIMAANAGAGNSRKLRGAQSPVVAGGRIFVMDISANVIALSLSGETVWQSSVRAEFDAGGEAPAGGVAVAGNTVLAATGFGELVALDASSGAIRWRQRFDSPLASAATVQGQTAFVTARDGSLAAVSINNGRVLWQDSATPLRRTLIGSAAPAITDRLAVFPMASGELVAYDLKEGTGVWRAGIAGQNINLAAAQNADITGDPVVANGLIYAASQGGRMVAIDADDGRRVWSANEGAVSAPLVVGGAVFAVNEQNQIIRLDAQTGDLVWRHDMPYFTQEKAKRRKAIHAQFGPVLAGGRLAVAGADGWLRLFDPASGTLSAQVEIPSGAASAPVLAQGMLFVLGQNGQIFAFR